MIWCIAFLAVGAGLGWGIRGVVESRKVKWRLERESEGEVDD